MMNTSKLNLGTGIALVVIAILASTSLTRGADVKKVPKPYPLDSCLITGKKLDLTSKKTSSLNYQGQEIKFCCPMCEGDFKKDATKYMAKVDAANKKVKPYPLNTCLVSGEKLGGMGDPYVIVRQGQEVKFCCKGCLKDFAKDEAAYLKKIPAAKK